MLADPRVPLAEARRIVDEMQADLDHRYCEKHPRSVCCWSGQAWICLDGAHMAAANRVLPMPTDAR